MTRGQAPVPPAGVSRPTTPADALRAIWSRRRGEVLERVDLVEAAVTALLAGALDPDLRAEAHRAAHKLTGSAGTFGFATASDVAREIEAALDPARPLDAGAAPSLAERVLTLRDELEREPGAPPGAVPVVGAPAAEATTLLIVSDDRELAERLAVEAAARDLRTETVAGPTAARDLVGAGKAAAVVIDLALPAQHEQSLDLIERASTGGSATPVVCLVDTGAAFVDRVEVARRGARGHLPRSSPPGAVLDWIRQLLEQRAYEAATVLAIDDDPAVLEAVTAMLAPEGLTVQTSADPARFWDMLEARPPDVLLLDLDMPDVNGIELCRALRNDARWSRLPVLFLTAYTDSASVTAIFDAGADDYIVKPVVGSELIARICNRIERLRLYRTLAERDSLTGVATRRQSSEGIERLARLSTRFSQPLCLAILDLDGFKQVNDRHGHAAGDEVLQRLGSLLQKTFRGEDVIGRWGGEEFAVGLYSARKPDAVQRLAETLEAFRGLEFGPEHDRFSVTFSAGVAEYPHDGEDVRALYRAADAALYQAKAAGRDRVVAAGTALHAQESVDVALVEDDEALVDLLAHALETRGLSVARIADGRNALEQLGGARPGLTARVVLLDVDLPGLDGLSVLRGLARDGILASTRTIVLTARAAETEVLAALELGAFDHVAKPFSLPVLMQRVRRALDSSAR